jgi:hypothetical protein
MCSKYKTETARNLFLSPLLKEFEGTNPHITVQALPVGCKHPIIIAEYANGFKTQVCIRNKSPEGMFTGRFPPHANRNSPSIEFVERQAARPQTHISREMEACFSKTFHPRTLAPGRLVASSYISRFTLGRKNCRIKVFLSFCSDYVASINFWLSGDLKFLCCVKTGKDMSYHSTTQENRWRRLEKANYNKVIVWMLKQAKRSTYIAQQTLQSYLGAALIRIHQRWSLAAYTLIIGGYDSKSEISKSIWFLPGLWV